jgi:quinol monooxygenase YgiN
MLIVTGYMHVDPADLPKFLGDTQALADATRQREGNISYDAAVVDPQTGRLLTRKRSSTDGRDVRGATFVNTTP